jgi:glutamate-ammonia-ligase adenylyltransferase
LDNKGFAVIGYGKLGGIELGYGSDLDLVFIHAFEEQVKLMVVKALAGLSLQFVWHKSLCL